jgi:hypothetical protein
MMSPDATVDLAASHDDDKIDAAKAANAVKFEIDEAQREGSEDERPAVFKSTGWEICAVIALVCAQLTNVRACILSSYTESV